MREGGDRVQSRDCSRYIYAELQANSQIAGFGERPASRPSDRRVARHFIRYVMPLFDLRLRNRGALLSGP